MRDSSGGWLLQGKTRQAKVSLVGLGLLGALRRRVILLRVGKGLVEQVALRRRNKQVHVTALFANSVALDGLAEWVGFGRRSTDPSRGTAE